MPSTNIIMLQIVANGLGEFKNDDLTEGIESALPYGSDSDSTDIIEELMQSIAESE